MQDQESIEAVFKAGIRSLAQVTPFTAVIGQAWSEWETITRFNRIEEMFAALKTEFGRLENEMNQNAAKIRESPELPILFESTGRAAMLEPSDTKREYLARLLAQLVAAADKFGPEEKLNLIDTLQSLGESDLQLLAKFSEDAPRIDDEDDPNLIGEIWVSLSKLVSRGLAYLPPTGVYGLGPLDKAPRKQIVWRDRYYRLMPHGEKLVHLLGLAYE